MQRANLPQSPRKCADGAEFRSGNAHTAPLAPLLPSAIGVLPERSANSAPVPACATPEDSELLECFDCGLVQRAGTQQRELEWLCVRCSAQLRQATTGPTRVAAFAACAALVLLLVGVGQPLFELHLLGRFTSASPLSGPRAMAQRGLTDVGIVVTLTLLAAPLAHIAVLLIGLIGARARKPPRWLVLPLGLLSTTRRWSMVDVYLLAVLVCYVRLRSWSHVAVGHAVIVLLSLLLVTLAAETSLDAPALWRRMRMRAPLPKRKGPRIACAFCGLVQCAPEGLGCARCGHRLEARKPRSLARATALLLAALLLCVPANLLPVMDLERFGRSDARTILSGVVELTQHHLWGLSLVIFVASILIPLLKIAGLGVMLWMTLRKSALHLHLRTRLYRFIQSIGRWSLVDVFAVTILVSVVHMGPLASVLPGDGAVAFCAVVILTMFATEAFDPRLMWDAAGQNDNARKDLGHG